MNYFTFYHLPISFQVNEKALKRVFYANSKKYHPDFFTLENEEKQQEILDLSTFNNEAYKILSDFDQRMKYILQLKGMLEDEGKNKMPNDFLMEMMEINEALMELEFDYHPERYQQLLESLKNLESSIYQEIATMIEQYDDEHATLQDLEAIKNFYFKKRYLLRIKENLSKFASP